MRGSHKNTGVGSDAHNLSETNNHCIEDEAYENLTWGSYSSMQRFKKKDESGNMRGELENLQELLEAKNFSTEKFAQLIQSLDQVDEPEVYSGVLSVGQQAPDFMLKGARGKVFQLSSAVKKGKVVISFFRGGWCPYCYLELRGLQEFLPEFKKLATQVVAISSEKPDYCLDTQEKNGLEYPVLSDRANKVAQEYKLLQKSDLDVDLLKELGLNHAISSGDISFELPIPATYIIDEWMTVRYVYADPDYRNRAKPEFLLAKIRNLAKKN